MNIAYWFLVAIIAVNVLFVACTTDTKFKFSILEIKVSQETNSTLPKRECPNPMACINKMSPKQYTHCKDVPCIRK